MSGKEVCCIIVASKIKGGIWSAGSGGCAIRMVCLWSVDKLLTMNFFTLVTGEDKIFLQIHYTTSMFYMILSSLKHLWTSCSGGTVKRWNAE